MLNFSSYQISITVDKDHWLTGFFRGICSSSLTALSPDFQGQVLNSIYSQWTQSNSCVLLAYLNFPPQPPGLRFGCKLKPLMSSLSAPSHWGFASLWRLIFRRLIHVSVFLCPVPQMHHVVIERKALVRLLYPEHLLLLFLLSATCFSHLLNTFLGLILDKLLCFSISIRCSSMWTELHRKMLCVLGIPQTGCLTE